MITLVHVYLGAPNISGDHVAVDKPMNKVSNWVTAFLNGLKAELWLWNFISPGF